MFLGVNRLRCGGPGRGSLPAWPSWKLGATGSPGVAFNQSETSLFLSRVSSERFIEGKSLQAAWC